MKTIPCQYKIKAYDENGKDITKNFEYPDPDFGYSTLSLVPATLFFCGMHKDNLRAAYQVYEEMEPDAKDTYEIWLTTTHDSETLEDFLDMAEKGDAVDLSDKPDVPMMIPYGISADTYAEMGRFILLNLFTYGVVSPVDKEN